MSKLFTGIAIGLVLALLGYYALTVFSTNEIVSNDFARVTIKNASGKNVRSVVLQHENGSFEAIGLRVNEEIRFVFRNTGENPFSRSAVPSDYYF